MYTGEDIINGIKHMQNNGKYYITADAEEFAKRVINHINMYRHDKYIEEVFDKSKQDMEEKL